MNRPRRGAGAGLLAALAIAALLALSAPRTPSAGTNDPWPAPSTAEREALKKLKAYDKLPYPDLVRRLGRVKGATVISACGSTVAPWAYRGEHGQRLRPYAQDEHDKAWARGFVEMLLRGPDDWDVPALCGGASKPCREEHDAPLFVVALHLSRGGDIYALLHFDRRCALLFEPENPIGSIELGGRSDSLFEMLRSALPSDERVARMAISPSVDTLPPERDLRLTYTREELDSLPEALVRVPPRYPSYAQIKNVSGEVRLHVLVDSTGSVADAFVIPTHLKLLQDAALDAVYQWKFRPAIAGGRPVAVWVAVPVTFTLR